MDRIVKHYKLILFFGFAIVLVSLALGVVRTLNANVDPILEGILKRYMEIVPLLGLGFLKLGIGFAIVTIVKNISETGENAGGSFQKAGLDIPEAQPPLYARTFPKFLVIGIITELIATLVMVFWIFAFLEGNTKLDHFYEAIAVPMEGLGVAFLIGGISFGLATIVLNLGTQVKRLPSRLELLVKGGDKTPRVNPWEIPPEWLIAVTAIGMFFTASGFIPIAIVRGVSVLQGVTEPGTIALVWDTWIFMGIATLLFAISFWLLTIIKWLRAQREDLGKTVSNLSGEEVPPLEDRLPITKVVPYLAIAGLIWMLAFFIISLANIGIGVPFGFIVKPGRAISLSILFTGIGLALMTIVINLKKTAFMLPGGFSKIQAIIKGDTPKVSTSQVTGKPMDLAPKKLFIGILIGAIIVILGTLIFATWRIIVYNPGDLLPQAIVEHIIGPWNTFGVGIIFLMIGLFFDTIVGFVKARKTIITEGVETCVYYTLQKKV